MAQDAPAVSVLAAGLKARCPRCGQGALFRGGLALREQVRALRARLRLRRLRRRPRGVRHLHPGLRGARRRAAGRVQAARPPVWVHIVLWGMLTPLLAFFLLARPEGDADCPAVQAQGRAGPLRLGLSDTAMLARLKRAGLLWPTASRLPRSPSWSASAPGSCSARQWKEALIAKIAARVKAEPVSLAVALPQVRARAATSSTCTWWHAAASTTTRSATSMRPPSRASAGTSIRRWNSRPGRIVWVNRGFVPDACKEPAIAARQGQRPMARRGIAGIVRLPPQPGLVHPAERSRPQSLVLAGHCRHDGVRVRGASRSRQLPVHDRRRRPAAIPARLAARRGDAPRPAQPPPGIRADLVRPGADADRCLCGLRGDRLRNSSGA